MEDLTPNEVARLHLKARHGTLTPEEQSRYSEMEPASVKRRSGYDSKTRKAPQLKRSMQGVINRCDKGGTATFRSEMELLRLIRDDLAAERSWDKQRAGK